jgi:hypothetical protein
VSDRHRFYRHVPKGYEANLRFRRSLVEQGDADPRVAEQLRLACAKDILFFANSFVWIFEPRTKDVLPFVSWKVQDKGIRAIDRRIRRAASRVPGRHDLPIEKSRDMGASWMCLIVFFHWWLYEPHSTFLLGSRTQDYVDKPDEPKSLFWKIDHIIRHLPPWLTPDFGRTTLKLKNNENGAVITGESTNANFARGGRNTAILLDEFAALESSGCPAQAVLAATADVTKCRIFNSTHQGIATQFHGVVQRARELDPEDGVLVLHWRDHPEKGAGLYQSDSDGTVRKLDPGYAYPEDYPFILDGKLRSPAYDEEAKTRHPKEMAQEWDIDPSGSDVQFFDQPTVERLVKETARPPAWRGEIEYARPDVKFVRFERRDNGRFWFWRHFEVRPPADRDYGVGIDIAAGSGASNSVIVVMDQLTREVVMEYADPFVKPERLAEIAAAVGQCFSGPGGPAFLVWEANGSGGSNFTEEVVKLHRRYYLRTNELSLSKKRTDTPGWWSTPVNRVHVMNRYRAALEQGQVINRSVDSLNECLHYIYTKNSSVVHALAANATDPSGANANHGDRVMAAALALKALDEMGGLVVAETPAQAPVGSLGWRQEQRRRRRAESEYY